jgi:hypothetical protein
VASDLARGVQALAARLRRLLQRCRGRTITSGWRGIRPCDATCLSPLGAPASGLRAWSPAIMEVISMDERSLPDFWPSCAHAPGLATRTTSVDRLGVCPTGAVLCRWNRANPHTQGARPLGTGGSQVVSMGSSGMTKRSDGIIAHYRSYRLRTPPSRETMAWRHIWGEVIKGGDS